MKRLESQSSVGSASRSAPGAPISTGRVVPLTCSPYFPPPRWFFLPIGGSCDPPKFRRQPHKTPTWSPGTGFSLGSLPPPAPSSTLLSVLWPGVGYRPCNPEVQLQSTYGLYVSLLEPPLWRQDIPKAFLGCLAPEFQPFNPITPYLVNRTQATDPQHLWPLWTSFPPPQRSPPTGDPLSVGVGPSL